METTFYFLGIVALLFFIVDKIMEWIMDILELRQAIRSKRRYVKIRAGSK